MSELRGFSIGRVEEGLTGSDVCQDGDLRGYFDVAEQESPEEASEWTFIPLVKWVEDEFVTPVCISNEG
jgi:hypothetical protein